MSVAATTKPLHVFLNYACQAKCGFCYNPALTPELIAWRLTLEDVAKVLVAQRDAGCDSVTFSGGEVTLLKDLPAMIRLARKAGYAEAGIITNALRLAEPGYTESLAAAGLTFCVISVHAAAPAVHDALLEVPGAFAKVLAALEALKAASIPVVLNFVTTAKNVGELPAFVARFAGEPGVVELQAYLPHYEGLMALPANDAALRLPLSRARLPLSEAVEAARAAGAEGKLKIGNVPPCLLPEHEARLFNWEKEEGRRLLVDPAGAASGSFKEERRGRVKNEACAACALEPRCAGFEAAYAARFGTADARPRAA